MASGSTIPDGFWLVALFHIESLLTSEAYARFLKNSINQQLVDGNTQGLNDQKYNKSVIM